MKVPNFGSPVSFTYTKRHKYGQRNNGGNNMQLHNKFECEPDYNRLPTCHFEQEAPEAKFNVT